MNKKIKSLLIAGLLVLGMGGTAFADSFTAAGTSGWADFNIVYNSQKGFEVKLVSANAQDPDVTLVITTTTDFVNKNNLTAVRVVLSDGSSVNIPLSELELVNKGSYIENSVLLSKVGITRDQIKSVNVDYEPKNYDPSVGEDEKEPEQGQDPVETPEDGKINNSFFDIDSIYNQYKQNMSALGVLEGTVRTIEESNAISRDSWEQFINDFNNEDNGMEITYDEKDVNNNQGVFKVFVVVGDQKQQVETINISFFDVAKKGWLPEITPGTGQAIAVGGLVIVAGASVGLLVNNKKRKNEEK